MADKCILSVASQQLTYDTGASNRGRKPQKVQQTRHSGQTTGAAAKLRFVELILRGSREPIKAQPLRGGHRPALIEPRGSAACSTMQHEAKPKTGHFIPDSKQNLGALPTA